ncbi:hypothetical protein TUM4438_46630 [Shewanella sairae]|uniref:C-type lysozyme inhibitor domain-containing protein n=1 Tax=Shewanella sairae TaxID=190310 RepID=A0ABQ4NSK5_9GAMM|nr:hypothetical protein [Shewanella sairae]GIU02128.1 hypothetical protein TUM4438_46630 [Shewanella sairae]
MKKLILVGIILVSFDANAGVAIEYHCETGANKDMGTPSGITKTILSDHVGIYIDTNGKEHVFKHRREDNTFFLNESGLEGTTSIINGKVYTEIIMDGQVIRKMSVDDKCKIINSVAN